MNNILTKECIRLNSTALDKTDAIRQAGDLLVKAGYVAQAYVEGMLAREVITSTYLGNGVAIPHGRSDDKDTVYQTGLSVVQFPDGVEWEEGEKACLVVGIAAVADEHVDILTNLAEVIEDPAQAEQLVRATEAGMILERLNRSPQAQD